jgi:hypothetical protein
VELKARVEQHLLCSSTFSFLKGGLLEAMFNTGNVKFGLGDHALVLRMVYL